MAYLFGDMALDSARRELRVGSTSRALEPQVFDLLEFLIRHREHVVSRDDLLAAVWRGRLVSDSAIDARIAAARRAIGDTGEQQRWIRTITRKGFRFVGDVQEEATVGTPSTLADEGAQQISSGTPRDQEITFCRTKAGVNIAIALAGCGMPLVRTSTWITHVEYDWQSPIRAPLLHFLADRFRLIRYDCRCNGLSDWEADEFSFEALLHDLETVIDSLGVRSYALLGISQGASLAIAHAVRYPERVSKMVLLGGYALGLNKRSARKGFDLKTFIDLMREGWGDEHSPFQRMLAAVFLPNASAEQIKWLADLQRVSASPENVVRLRNVFDEIDVVDLLPKVSVPTLVLHSLRDNLSPFEEGRRIASLIPNAKFVAIDSENHVPQSCEPAWPKLLEAIDSFLLNPGSPP